MQCLTAPMSLNWYLSGILLAFDSCFLKCAPSKRAATLAILAEVMAARTTGPSAVRLLNLFADDRFDVDPLIGHHAASRASPRATFIGLTGLIAAATFIASVFKAPRMMRAWFLSSGWSVNRMVPSGRWMRM